MDTSAEHIDITSFFEDYTDPEISKRLHFEVWADRNGLGGEERDMAWAQVISRTRRDAARKRYRRAGAGNTGRQE